MGFLKYKIISFLKKSIFVRIMSILYEAIFVTILNNDLLVLII